MAGRDGASERVVTGRIGPALLRLAWPVIAGEALHVAFHLVDIAWVRPLGAWATAAIMASMFAMWAAFALTHLVGTGLSAHVSRAIGAGQREAAAIASATGLLLALGLSLVVVVAGQLGAPALFAALTEDDRVAMAGVAYLRIVTSGAPATFAIISLTASLRAAGNTRLPLVVVGAATVLNMGLTPLLIFGWGAVPAMGVAGSGAATVVSQVLAAVVLLIIAVRGHADLPFDLAALARPAWSVMASVARIGAPHACIGVLFSVVYLWYGHLAGAQGAAAVAVLGIANRLESLTYLTADGFGVAAATMVGQNLGAGRPDRAARAAAFGAWLSGAVGAVVMLAMLLVPELLLLPFTDDPEALRLGATYVRVLALCQIPTAVEGVIGGAFAGAGDTVPPMIIHVVSALVRFPAAGWAATGLGLGVIGIGWSMTITCILRAAVLVAWFSRGSWKSREIHGLRARPLPAADGPDASA